MEQPSSQQAGEAHSASAGERYKTLGVRIDESLHAQLSFIAQLTGGSITEEIRRSLEAHVSAAQADPDLMARADQIRTEMEREAAARRSAIAGFFGKQATTAVAPSARRGSSAGKEPTA